MTRTWKHLAKYGVAVLVGALAIGGLSAPAWAFDGTTLYSPNTTTNPDDRVSYPHAIRLQNSGSANGQILSTFERRTTNTADTGNGTVSNPARGWVIERSTDGGSTFSQLALITPAEFPSWPYTVQPHLLELSQATGGYPAGTLLLSVILGDINGTGVGQTRLQIYRSTDHGVSWSWAGNVINTASGAPRVWEPNLMQLANGSVAVYFAYEGQGNGPSSQTIVHKLSTDGGSTWGAITTDWQYPSGSANYNDRPGMPSVTKMGTGGYLMAIESCGFPGEYCQIRVKSSTDGLTWGSGPTDLGTRIQAAGSGHGISGNPYLAWAPGGPKGRVYMTAGEITNSLTDYGVTGNTHQTLFVNDNYGVGPWSEYTAPVKWKSGGTQSGYRSSLLPSESGNSMLYLTASWSGSGLRNSIVYGQSNSGVLPFSDQFASGTDVGWQTYGGTWGVNIGEYSVTSTGRGEKSLFGSTGWSDYTMQSDVKLNAAGNAGLLVRTLNPRVGADAHRGYYVGISTADGGVFLGRQNDDWTRLGAVRPVSGGITAGTWYHVVVKAVGCTFTIAVRPVASTAAPTTFAETDAGCNTTGQPGVRMDATPASWRNIVVTAADSTAAPGPYLDSFAAGSTTGYTTYGGTWSVNAGTQVYQNTSGGLGEKAVLAGVTGVNYTVQSNVRLDQSVGAGAGAGLTLRTSSPAVGENSLSGYYVGLDAASNALVIRKHQNNATTLATSAAIASGGVIIGNWYHLSVRVNGCTITASAQRFGVAEQTTTSATDCAITSGAVGLRASGAKASWAVVTVTAG